MATISAGLTYPAWFEVEKPSYAPSMQEEDREYVIKKLGLTEESFKSILDAEPKTYQDYPSYGQFLEGPLVGGLYILARNLYRFNQRRHHSKA